MDKNNNPVEDQPESKKMGFFDSVLEPPNWLTEDYVQEALKNFERDPKLKITKYSLSTCTKPGDNFVGVMFRAHISYNTRNEVRNESFIVKIKPFLDGIKKDMMENTPLFKTEGRIYVEVLPKMQDLLANIKDSDTLAPGLIHCATNPDILIFRDIAPEGFVMQHMPVPFKKASQIAQKLGKFHALSYFMIEERGESVVTTFEEGMFCENSTLCDEKATENSLQVLSDKMKEWDQGLELMADKIAKLKPHLVKKLTEQTKPKPKGQGINVLNHGDFHMRNLLFRHDDQDDSQFEAIRLIDFQLSFYGSPAYDLSYLMIMIANAECRQKHRDELLGVYYAQFAATLTDLGFLGKIPTLLDFQVEVLKNGLLELYMATVFLTIYYMDVEMFNDIDFTNEEQITRFSQTIFEIPEYKAELLRIFPEFMYKGYLDV